MLSKCCQATLRPWHKKPKKGQTNFYICNKCNKVCNFLTESNEMQKLPKS